MEKRLNEIKLIIKEQENAGYRVNNLNTIDMKWLIEQAEKYQKIEQSWKEGIKKNEETIFFLRKCKEVIENFKIETRKKMS